MKSHIVFNWSFLVAVFLVGLTLADDSSDTSDANDKFLKNLDCISKSGNQDLCDEYVNQCNEQLPTQVLKAYYDCVLDLFNNEINECSDDEELYFSADDRKELNNCIFSRVDSSQLSDIDLQLLAYVGQCTEDLAEQAGCADDDSS